MSKDLRIEWALLGKEFQAEGTAQAKALGSRKGLRLALLT